MRGPDRAARAIVGHWTCGERRAARAPRGLTLSSPRWPSRPGTLPPVKSSLLRQTGLAPTRPAITCAMSRGAIPGNAGPGLVPDGRRGITMRPTSGLGFRRAGHVDHACRALHRAARRVRGRGDPHQRHRWRAFGGRRVTAIRATRPQGGEARVWGVVGVAKVGTGQICGTGRRSRRAQRLPPRSTPPPVTAAGSTAQLRAHSRLDGGRR